jgi:HK97 family phage major capsid protein
MPGPIDASGIIPPNQAREIISVATANSGVLALARRQPMPAGVSQLPVQTGIPTAAWLTKVGDRKPFTDMTLGMKTMTAEEVATTIAIPQAYLDDVSIDLWAWARPQLGAAIALALDNAVLFGTNAPATFPAGGVTAAAFCQDVPPGTDPLETVNDAYSAVEAQGLPVTGSLADLSVKGPLRGVRDSTGAFLLGPGQSGSDAANSIYGQPVSWGQFPVGAADDFVTGNWSSLIVGVRQDIRYDLSDQGVIADSAGKVLITAFQDDQVLMRCHARFGVLVINPPTQKFPAGAKPFAKSTVGSGVAAAEASSSGSSSGGSSSSSKR